MPSLLGGFGFDGGGDGNPHGDGHVYGGDGDIFGGDDDVFGGGGDDDSDGYYSDSDGDGWGGGGNDRNDAHLTEAPHFGRAILDRQQPRLPRRRVWTRVGRPMENRAASGNSANSGSAMRRSMDVYDPLGIL